MTDEHHIALHRYRAFPSSSQPSLLDGAGRVPVGVDADRMGGEREVEEP